MIDKEVIAGIALIVAAVFLVVYLGFFHTFTNTRTISYDNTCVVFVSESRGNVSSTTEYECPVEFVTGG